MANFIQIFGQSIRGIDTSRQLALGMSLGMVIGLLPKDNLLVAGLLVFLIMSGANLVSGAMSGVAITIVSSRIEPSTHGLGEMLLGLHIVVVPLTKFLQLPLAAWTRLDNTTVFGSFTTGLLFFLPVYLISFFVFERYRESIQRMFTDSWLATWIVGYSPIDN